MDKNTLLYKGIVVENGQKTKKKTKGPERLLTFTKETPYESKYLTHRVLPNIGATGAPGKMVNFGHQAHVFMDLWCIPTKAHNKTPQFNKFYHKCVCHLLV